MFFCLPMCEEKPLPKSSYIDEVTHFPPTHSILDMLGTIFIPRNIFEENKNNIHTNFWLCEIHIFKVLFTAKTPSYLGIYTLIITLLISQTICFRKAHHEILKTGILQFPVSISIFDHLRLLSSVHRSPARSTTYSQSFCKHESLTEDYIIFVQITNDFTKSVENILRLLFLIIYFWDCNSLWRQIFYLLCGTITFIKKGTWEKSLDHCTSLLLHSSYLSQMQTSKLLKLVRALIASVVLGCSLIDTFYDILNTTWSKRCNPTSGEMKCQQTGLSPPCFVSLEWPYSIITNFCK